MPVPDISKFQDKRILVVGDIMLDEFIYTTSTRQSPEYKDAPVYDVREKYQYAGGAANVAQNIKSLGAIPYLIGVIGNDSAGKKLIELLNYAGITQDYLFTYTERNTTVKTRILNNGEAVCRIDEEDASDFPGLVYNFIFKNIAQCIKDHKPHAIIIQDYNKGVLNPVSIKEILSLARQHNIPVCVDPKFKNWELYTDVDLFKPNMNEFKIMSDELRVENTDLKFIAEKLHDKIQFKNLLVTLGSDGNYIYNNDHSQLLTLNSQLSTPDVCGAGDTVIAVSTLGLVCGFSLPEIAKLANEAGYIACQKKNVQPITYEELLNTKY